MSVKLNISRTAGLRKFEGDLQRRLENVGRQLGRHLSEKATREVQRRLKGSGWIRIYRQAIFYRETPDGGEWAVAGLSERDDLFEFPADKSLAYFSATGDGIVPSQNNPWPIDMIPPAFYRGTSLSIRAASVGEVENYRGARARNRPGIIADLESLGVSVKEDGLPVVGGKIYADIAYLARRLELGYPGFDRIPHWGPAASTVERSGDDWLGEPRLLRLLEGAIKGREPSEVPQMTKAEASDLARLREATWP